MKKILKYLSLTIPLLVATGIIFVVTILSVSIYYQSYIGAIFYTRFVNKAEDLNIGTLIGNIPDITTSYLQIITYIIPIIWAVLFYFWYRKLIGKKVERKIKLFTFKNLTLLILIGVACQLIIIGFMELVLPHFEKLMQDYTELMSQLLDMSPIMMFFSIVIFAPISEELIFRGVILKKASQISPFIVANIIQALFFAIFHMNIVQGFYTFGVGLILGYVAHKYQTIIASILLHLFFNASSYIMISPKTEYMNVIYIVIGAIIVIFALNKVKKEGTIKQAYAIDIDTFSE